ncbi:shikimate kinase [Pseudoluteimonas lycopersici]|uniref:Shikimate kinase n=1 Tax=Pseudoluteimonas lycopersici TaxID=1324796 RepID=A0A516V4T9_9GAMM|nr:shikimate kinase [Lysobacter lycopersici]QDQ73532.1 shikimate kinase [Lysobacter lycopersici]
MNPAPNLALVGPMGAGKSAVGRLLAERLGLRFADLDHEVEDRSGAGIATIFECEGEAGFRARESAALQALLADDGLALATGGGAVLDADNRRLLRERCFVVHLHLDVSAQLQRLARDRSRPLLQRPDREQALQELASIRGPLYDEVADLRFDTGNDNATHAAMALAELLAVKWQRGNIAA